MMMSKTRFSETKTPLPLTLSLPFPFPFPMACCFALKLLLLLIISPHLAVGGGSTVKILPGFEGPLPFELETGYIGVGESEDVQLFYYFIKSESNPMKDPLLFWLTGGPGCSGLSGLIYEIGPVKFEGKVNNSLPTLILNPFSWTKVASIIFVDSPVGTGFSYSRTSKAWSDDTLTSEQAYHFLRKWLVDHPEFIQNPLYVGGDSYSGITVPVVADLISKGNEVQIGPYINLKGYLIGNAKASPSDGNYAALFAHGLGLIPDELYESLVRNCRGEYVLIDPSNTWCLQDVNTFQWMLSEINYAHVLEPHCNHYESPKHRLLGERGHLDIFEVLNNLEQPPELKCRVDWYLFSYQWANDERVQDALNVRKGSVEQWRRCNLDLPFTVTIENSVPYHADLTSKGYRSLVYSGDHDMLMPHQATQAWIRSLNYPVTDKWRPWMVEGQVGGYTRTFTNLMTFATVKGGGHTAPEYKPAECFAMFARWISDKPL